MRYAYPCNIVADAGEFEVSGRIAFNVDFPDVVGANTGAWSRDEAMRAAEDCLGVALGAYVKDGEGIPVPSPLMNGQVLIPVPPIVAAKLALYSAMRDRNIKKVELARKLNIHENAVRRILDPTHRSHISSVENALAAVGRSLIIEDVPARGHKAIEPAEELKLSVLDEPRVAVRS